MKVTKVQRKRYTEPKSSFSKYNHEITGLILFSLGILALLSIYFQNSIGIVGELTRELLLGLLGYPSFLIPPIMIVYSIFVIFKKDDNNLNMRVVYIIILLMLISAIVETGFYNSKNYTNMTFEGNIVKFYNDGKELNGGGVFGGIISMPLLRGFQVIGTIIILTTVSIIDIVLLTNISIANVLTMIASVLNNIRLKLMKMWFSILEVLNRHNTSVNDHDTGIAKFKDTRKSEEKTKSKVINFSNEKNTRELKEKQVKENIIKENEVRVTDNNSDVKAAVTIEPTELVIEEIKRKNEDKAKKQNENISFKINMQENRDMDYNYPHIELLKENTEEKTNSKSGKNSSIESAKKLEDTLKSFGVEAKVINISRGPAVTRFELQPSPGVKVSKIVNLSDDISLNLAASGVRIEAPIPGKAAIGIEVPNKEVVAVLLRQVVESGEFLSCPSKLAFALGKDISGNNVVADIAKMPHLLIAGATGSGKSVCINSLIISLLYKASPNEIKLLMIDPKVVELGIYNGIPHLLIPVVTEPKKAAGALNWAVQEMVNRYKLFADKGVRDIKGYNSAIKEADEQGVLPQIVIIIDELADLMMVAPNDVEDSVCRLAQMARAAGMHLVIATQRPSVDVITGVIKANIPSRISFAVSSQVDSRTILDMTGAEKLLGKGDMLFYPVGEPKPIRIKGAFVSDKEVERIVEFIKSTGNTEYNNDIIEEINSENGPVEEKPSDKDELLPQAIELVVEAGQASVSLIQRKFKVGYARAARIVDQMEARGIVGCFEGSKPRQILITRQQWQELQMAEKQ